VSADEVVDVRLVPAALAVWATAALVVGARPGALVVGAAVLGALAAGVLAGPRDATVAGEHGARDRARGAVAALPARSSVRAGGIAPSVRARPALTREPLAPPARARPASRAPGGLAPSAVGRRAVRVPAHVALRAQAGLALGAVAVLLLATAGQVRAREAGDVRALAEDRARVRLVGVVRSTPQEPGGAGGSRVVRFLLAATSVEVLGPAGAGPGDVDGGAGTTGAAAATGSIESGAVDVVVSDVQASAVQRAAPQAAAAQPAAAQPAAAQAAAAQPAAAQPAAAQPAGPRATSAAVEVYAPATASDLAYGTVVAVEATLSPLSDASRRAMARARADGDPAVRAPPPAALRAADALRTGLVGTAAAVPGDAGRLLPAVAVGDTRGVGDLDEAMRVSGLAHITAVSGAHFSILGAVVLAVLTRCGVPRRWRWLPLAVVLGGFVAVVQPGSSVVRAAVMGAVGVLGIVAGRPARSVPALACAVLVLLVVDPWLARDVGFVLSVVATAGIALLAGPLARRWSAAPDRVGGSGPRPGDDPRPAAGPVATAFAVPVAAQAACAPVLLVLTPAVPAYAVLANVAAAPAVAPATVGGLLAALLGWWPAAAAWCAQAAGAACWWIAAVARTAAGLPGAQVAWAGGPLGQVLLACACGAALVLVLRCRRAVGP
jgi:competence protein ComEC